MLYITLWIAVLLTKCDSVVAKSYVIERRAEMQTKWRGIMGILKDHMSYMLVPEMKVSTDMVAV